MAFSYPAIDLNSTITMWNNILDRIERDNKKTGTEVSITFNREKLLRFAERDFLRREKKGKPWNGRQIRNAFNTAIGLGRWQKLESLGDKTISAEEASASGGRQVMEVKLTKRNFQDVATAAREFEDYIQDLRGMSDSEIARLAKVRDDRWGSKRPAAAKDYSHLRKSTAFKSGQRPRPSAAMVGSTVKDPDPMRSRPAQVERHNPESIRSDDSDDESSDDD